MVSLHGQMATLLNQQEEILRYAEEARIIKDQGLFCMLLRQEAKLGLELIELDKILDQNDPKRDKLEAAYIKQLECGLITFGADNKKYTTPFKKEAEA